MLPGPASSRPSRTGWDGCNMYNCGRCGEKLITEFSPIGIQCSKCGYKIFYKERPNRKKVIKAR